MLNDNLVLDNVHSHNTKSITKKNDIINLELQWLISKTIKIDNKLNKITTKGYNLYFVDL